MTPIKQAIEALERTQIPGRVTCSKDIADVIAALRSIGPATEEEITQMILDLASQNPEMWNAELIRVSERRIFGERTA